MSPRLYQYELIRRVVKNSGYLFSATGMSGAISFLQGILAARLLGVANYGILGTIIMFTSVVNKFVSFRMGELVIKYVGHFNENHDPQRAAAVFKAAALAEMSASLAAYGLIALLAPLGARYLTKDPQTVNLFLVYGLIVVTNLISESSTGLLQIFNRFRRIASLTVLQSLLTLALVAGAYLGSRAILGYRTILFHGDILGYRAILSILVAYLCGKTLGAVGITFTALQEAGKRWGSDWWRTPLKLLQAQSRELIHFGISTNISASLSLINKDSELLWVSLFRNPVETGYYSLALSLSNLVLLPVSPLPQATYPELSRETARKNWKNVRMILRQGSLLAGGYTLAASLGLVILGQPLIHYFYKPEFLPAYPALLILLAGFLVANTFYWNRTALLALGKPGFPTRVNLALAILKVIGVLLLVPRYGYLVNAALVAGAFFVGVSLCVWKTYQQLAIKDRSASKEALV